MVILNLTAFDHLSIGFPKLRESDYEFGLCVFDITFDFVVCSIMNLTTCVWWWIWTLCVCLYVWWWIWLCVWWLCCMLDDDLSCDLPRCPSRGTPADWMSPDPAVHPTPHWPRCRTLTSSQTRHLKWQLYDLIHSVHKVHFIIKVQWYENI